MIGDILGVCRQIRILIIRLYHLLIQFGLHGYKIHLWIRYGLMLTVWIFEIKEILLFIYLELFIFRSCVCLSWSAALREFVTADVQFVSIVIILEYFHAF